MLAEVPAGLAKQFWSCCETDWISLETLERKTHTHTKSIVNSDGWGKKKKGCIIKESPLSYPSP